MKVRLNYEQVAVLYAFFTDLMNLGGKVSFSSMQARLCYLMLHGFYEKLHTLILPKGAKPKPKYTLSLDEKESLAFFLFFSAYQIPERHIQAAMLIQAMINEINEQYV